jgi:aminopeptidase I
VPIIGLAPSDSEDSTASASTSKPTTTGGTFGPLPERHSQKLLKAISSELGISPSRIVDFSLELFDFQPASLLGLSQEFISGPRLDDKLCSFSALWALINASSKAPNHGTESEKRKGNKTRGGIQMIAFFDNEEIGSMLRNGAKGNFLQSVIERVVEAQPGVSTKKKTTNTRVSVLLSFPFL